MLRTRSAFSSCLFGWLLAGLFLSAGGAGTAQAHTMGETQQRCPLDNHKFTATMDFSGTSFGVRLDLKPLGPTPAPWRLAVCPKDHFVLYQDEFSKQEIAQLKKYIPTPAYQKLVKEQHTSYFLVGKIFEYLGKNECTIGHVYLKATWQVEEDAAKYRTYAEEALKHFSACVIASKESEDEIASAEVLAVELERRLKRFDEAQARLTRIAAKPKFQKGVLSRVMAYEKELVGKQNSEPQALPENNKPENAKPATP